LKGSDQIHAPVVLIPKKETGLANYWKAKWYPRAVWKILKLEQFLDLPGMEQWLAQPMTYYRTQ
jgi:hypothetical protein